MMEYIWIRLLLRRVEVEDVRSRVEQLRTEKWDVFAARRNDGERALILRAARKRCGVTLREAVEAAGGMKPAAVDTAIRRLEQRAQNTPGIAADQRVILRSLDAGVLMKVDS
jgi:hypothetical protein